jgi:hypothetical protein
MEDARAAVAAAARRQRVSVQRTADALDAIMSTLRAAQASGAPLSAVRAQLGLGEAGGSGSAGAEDGDGGDAAAASAAPAPPALAALREEHRGYYAALSKAVKAGERAAAGDGRGDEAAAVLVPRELWSVPRAADGLNAAVVDQLMRSGAVDSGIALAESAGLRAPLVDCGGERPQPLSAIMADAAAGAEGVLQGRVADALAWVTAQAKLPRAGSSADGGAGVDGRRVVEELGAEAEMEGHAAARPTAVRARRMRWLALRLHLVHISELLRGRAWPVALTHAGTAVAAAAAAAGTDAPDPRPAGSSSSAGSSSTGEGPGKRARLIPQALEEPAATAAVAPTDAAALAHADSPAAPLLLEGSDAVPAALAYARASLRPFAALPEHVHTVGRAVAGIAILAPPLTPAPLTPAPVTPASLTPARIGPASPLDLFSDEARRATADAYVAARCAAAGVSPRGPLALAAEAGVRVGPALLGLIARMRVAGASPIARGSDAALPPPLELGQDLPIDVTAELPPRPVTRSGDGSGGGGGGGGDDDDAEPGWAATAAAAAGWTPHSVFADPVLRQAVDHHRQREQHGGVDAAEAPPGQPMLLTCGHVLSRGTLSQLSAGRARFKCPTCPAVQTQAQALPLLLE